MSVEEEYMDVFQNVETAIIRTYREHRNMTDYDVLRAFEVLVDDYSGEKIGRAPRVVRLSETERVLIGSIRTICDWRLGRPNTLVDESGEPIASPEPITVDEVIMCLKGLIKSAKMWNKERGQRGYLDFIAQYIR